MELECVSEAALAVRAGPSHDAPRTGAAIWPGDFVACTEIVGDWATLEGGYACTLEPGTGRVALAWEEEYDDSEDEEEREAFQVEEERREIRRRQAEVDIETQRTKQQLEAAFRELRELRAARDALRSADDEATLTMRDDHQSMRRVVDWTRDEGHRFPSNDEYDDDDDAWSPVGSPSRVGRHQMQHGLHGQHSLHVDEVFNTEELRHHRLDHHHHHVAKTPPAQRPTVSSLHHAHPESPQRKRFTHCCAVVANSQAHWTSVDEQRQKIMPPRRTPWRSPQKRG